LKKVINKKESVMSKTRRNFAAAHRHIKGNEDGFDHRLNRFVKKMKKNEHLSDYQDEGIYSDKINHKNYEEYIDEEDDNEEDNLIDDNK
jgi:hypothetical protein